MPYLDQLEYKGTLYDLQDSNLKEDLTLKADLPTETIENVSIASFTDGAEDVPVKELKVAIEPIQDLHGYDNPWPGGGNKNLLNVKNFSVTKSGLIITGNNEVLTINGTATGNISSLDTVWSVLEMVLNSTLSSYSLSLTTALPSGCDRAVVTSSSTIAQVPLSAGTYHLGIYIPSGTVFSNWSTKIQIEAGSTATSWTPYSNICPISGRDSVTVTRTGKNLFDGILEQGSFNDDGEESSTTSRLRTDYVVVPEGAVTLSTPTSNVYVHEVYGYDENKVFTSKLSSGISAPSGTITVPSGTKYTRFSLRYANNGMITPTGIQAQAEAGSTATIYEPYTADSYPIPLSSTIYGGTLDVGTGLLTVEAALITLDGTETGWSKYSTTTMLNSSLAIDTLPATGANIKGYCSHVATVNGNINVSYLAHLNNGRGLEFRLLTTYWGLADNEVATWKAFLAEQYANGTPVQILTYLQNPTTVQLTPTQVTTLLKDNNIFADSGDVKKLIYRADLGAYIEKLINA